MNNKKHLLITGGTGFLGSSLVNLLRHKYELYLLTRNRGTIKSPESNSIVYLGYEELKEKYAELRIDAVIHLATNYGRNGEVDDVIEANISLPINCLHLAVKHGTRVFINTDTYYNKRGIVYRPLPIYSLSKSSLHSWLDYYSDSIQIANVMVEHPYGPGDSFDKFIPTLIRKLLNQDPFIELTHGHQKRDFIFIRDAAHIYERIISESFSRSYRYKNYELGTGQSTPVRWLVDHLAGLAKYKGTLKYGALDYYEHEIMSSSADTSEIQALGPYDFLPLSDGLQNTFEAFSKIFRK